jgi:uncharacterized protein YutE (UPF0331/DUF86 family)
MNSKLIRLLQDGSLLKVLAGYSNRLVHFYHEITAEELYEICKNELDEILKIKTAFLDWLKVNSQYVDNTP